MTQDRTFGRFNLKHEKTRRLFDYWSDLRAGRMAPYKSEVTATGIGRVLAGNVFILERMPDGALRFRLAGSRLFDIFAIELRGMNGPTIMEAGCRQRFRDLVESCLAGPEIAVIRGEAAARPEDRLGYEMMLAPLRSDFDQMNRVLGCITPLNVHEQSVRAFPRRCRIDEATNFAFSDVMDRDAGGPLPGFAEEPEPFQADDGLMAIDGGKPKDRSAPRRGHLRLVKD